MTNPDRARTRDAVANQRPVVAGVTSERRRAIGADAQTLVDRESAGDGVVRWRRRIQPNNTEDA
jgi:hypothetical protein